MPAFDSSVQALEALNTLAFTLDRGNLTLGTSLVFTSGDGIAGEDASSGAAGAMPIVGGTNTGATGADTGGVASLSGGDANGGAGGAGIVEGGDSTLSVGGNVILQPGTGPGGDGLCSLSRSGIQMISRAAVPGPSMSVGQLRVWVQNSTPTRLIVTDDGSTDHIVGSSQPAVSSTVRVSGFTAVAGQIERYDPTGGTFTILMPASPVLNDRITFKNASSSATAVTLDGNGNSVEDPTTFSLGATTSLTGDGLRVTYQFDGTQWIVVA